MEWNSFLFGTVFGAALGAVFSVAADRLWRRYEAKVKITIEPSIFSNIRGEKGVGLKLTNRGRMPLPPYKIRLHHPGLGSLHHKDKLGPLGLLPGQQHEHEFVLTLNGQPTEVVQMWFEASVVSPKGRRDHLGYTFQILMEKSEQVLYENAFVGSALAAIVREVKLTNTMDKLGASEFKMLRVPQRSWSQWNRKGLSK